jgi:hypothetical protein
MSVFNLVPDPSFEYNINLWKLLNENQGLIAQSSEQAFSGTRCLSLTCKEVVPTGVWTEFSGIVEGNTYTFSIYVRAKATICNNYMQVTWRSGAEISKIETARVKDSAGEWKRITLTAVAPVGATHAEIAWWTEPEAIGDVHYMDAVMCNIGALLPYFDGDMPVCEWTGKLGESSSVKYNQPRFWENLLEQIQPLAYDDDDTNGSVRVLTQAVGTMWQDMEEIIRDELADPDDPNPGGITPGYGTVMDVDEAPESWLPWLAQFVGVTIPQGLIREQMENLILGVGGMWRCTPKAIEEAVRTTLTGEKHLLMVERFEGKAYKVLIVTFKKQTPHEAETKRIAEEAMPGGTFVVYVCVEGWTYQELKETVKTYQQLKEEYAPVTYAKLATKEP